MEVYDGNNVEDGRKFTVGWFCGSKTPPTSIVSTGSDLFIRIHSDSKKGSLNEARLKLKVEERGKIDKIFSKLSRL